MKVRRNESYLQWPCRRTRQATCRRHILWPQNSVSLLPHPNWTQASPSSPSCNKKLATWVYIKGERENPGAWPLGKETRSPEKHIHKIIFGVNAPYECTDNSSFVNGQKLQNPNAPYASECTRATRRKHWVSMHHMNAPTPEKYTQEWIHNPNAPSQMNAPGQAGTTIIMYI